MATAKLLRTPEVAEMTGIPTGTLRWWRHIGTGPKSFTLRSRVVYKEADVEAWIEEQYQAAQKEPA